ncbi:unnamed protein product [Caenorhabditis brenneri]
MAPSNSNHWTADPEYIGLLNYIIERAENVESPINIQRLVRDFKDKSGASQTLTCLRSRIEKLRIWIQGFLQIDTDTKVKVLFALSASVYAYFLRELRKNAFVQVDDNNRIVYYKAINGILKLRGDHSRSAKNKTAQFESKRSLLSMITDYFENKNNVDAVPKNKREKEMWNFFEFITEKCENIDSPLNISQLVKDFNENFGLSKSFQTFHGRVKGYCREIQKTEFLDTHSKVKQLFGLSGTLDSECLKEFLNDAVVEVDHLNRITKYAAINGRLILYGDHSSSAKRNSDWIEWRRNEKTVKKHCLSGDGEDSDENSMKKVDSDDDNNHLNECEDLFEPSKKTDDFDNETPIRYRSSSPKGTGSFSNNSISPNELDDYDTNNSIEDQVKLEPFRGSIQEDLSEIQKDEDIQQIPKPHQTLDEHNQFEEVPIKTEGEEQVEVKPETSHSSKIKFFEAMQSLIVCLDTPSLSWIKTKTHQKIQELEEHDEVILNNEISLIIELLIARMANHSVENLSNNVESVNLSNFLCYLKSAILNSNMSGVEELVKNISELIEEAQNKRISMGNVENALLAMLYIDGF